MNEEMIAELCRPIIGIENRTALEAFDIMADRIRGAFTRTPAEPRPGDGEMIEKLCDDRNWLAGQLLARANIHRSGNGVRYTLDDAAIDEMAAAAIAAYNPNERLREALERVAVLEKALRTARPRLAHRHACWSVRPSSEWAEHGSASYENCDCEIKIVDAALSPLPQGEA